MYESFIDSLCANGQLSTSSSSRRPASLSNDVLAARQRAEAAEARAEAAEELLRLHGISDGGGAEAKRRRIDGLGAAGAPLQLLGAPKRIDCLGAAGAPLQLLGAPRPRLNVALRPEVSVALRSAPAPSIGLVQAAGPRPSLNLRAILEQKAREATPIANLKAMLEFKDLLQRSVPTSLQLGTGFAATPAGVSPALLAALVSKNSAKSSEQRYVGDDDAFHTGRVYSGWVQGWLPHKWGFISSKAIWEVFESDIFFFSSEVEAAGLKHVMRDGLKVMFTTQRGSTSVVATHLQLASDDSASDEQASTGLRYLGDEDKFHTGHVYTGYIRAWTLERQWGFISSNDAWEVFKKDIFFVAKEVEAAGLEHVMKDGLEVSFTTKRGTSGVQATDMALVDRRKSPINSGSAVAEAPSHRVDKRPESPINSGRGVAEEPSHRVDEGAESPNNFGSGVEEALLHRTDEDSTASQARDVGEEKVHSGQMFTGVVRGWQPEKWGFISSGDAWELFQKDIFFVSSEVEAAGLEQVMADGLKVRFATKKGSKSVQATDICLADATLG